MVDHISQPAWLDVENFLSKTVVKADSALAEAVESAARAGMPPIEVAPTAGKFLMLLARISGAKRVLEIGTLAGYSTIWLARGIPADGTVISCEFLPEHAAVARQNVDRAGIGGKVEIRVGAALETLAELAELTESAGPFDLIFIDADKGNNVNYLRRALELSRPGTVVVVDNVVWEGAFLAPEASGDALAIRETLEFLGSSESFDATAIATANSKGWDGFAVAVVQ
ncbi:O-methyltransferase [Arthrobacter russicus]|uniref:O-methyltransferase YrrM n=1 Tax=Arthrobacter russicus TaxID=172040 RepID=A0ABU1JAU4_9MICC|nr:O-methyltransferase [Arthrobacter russicus]MDN5668760.1 O-methyltransferase [Renibacterium salmoninarum]MDR6269535.1 putative O-methyltransferase YrrM [Arthrobacter russicus]